MNLNELRIGNYVCTSYMKKSVLKVNAIHSDRLYFESIVENFKRDTIPIYVEPIKLTEEWVLKAGFVFKNGGIGWDTYSLKEVVITLVPTNKGKAICYCYNTSKYKPIKSVHELQNLFFSLCGEELVLSTEP